MDNRAFGGASLMLALTVVPTSLSCAFATSSTGSAPTTASIQADSEIVPTGPTADRNRPAKGQAALTDVLQGSDAGLGQSDPITEAGTDSTEAESPIVVTEEIRQRLSRFGGRYLSYDYRENPEARLEDLAALVTPSFYDRIAVPLPPALADSLVAERHVESAALISVVPISALPDGGGVYELSYAVTQTTTPIGSAEAAESERTQTISVVLDSENLVEDVR